MRHTQALLVQLVLSLGVYFSAYAASYSLSNLHPTFYSYVSYMVPIIGCLLPLSWAYAFWRVPDEARLSPSALAWRCRDDRRAHSGLLGGVLPAVLRAVLPLVDCQLGNARALSGGSGCDRASRTQASGEDFARVVQLLLLCPDRPEDRGEIRAIGDLLPDAQLGANDGGPSRALGVAHGPNASAAGARTSLPWRSTAASRLAATCLHSRSKPSLGDLRRPI